MGAKGETLKVDLSKDLPADLAKIDFSSVQRVVVCFRLSTFGSTNSLLDISNDLLEASWVLERLARRAQRITTKVDDEYYTPLVTATLHRPDAEMGAALADCALLLEYDDTIDAAARARLDELRDLFFAYDDEINAMDLKVPAMADWYFVNLLAAYSEWMSEAPEWVEDQMRKFPEHRVGFHRSAWSAKLGADCYTSHDAWVLPGSVALDRFFKVTGFRYRQGDFIEGELLVLDGRQVVRAGDVFVPFPARRYFASQVCAGFSITDLEATWSEGPFAWGREAQYRGFSEDGIPLRHHDRYFVDATGTMLVVDDGMFQHVFTDILPLGQRALKTLLAAVGTASEALSAGAGISAMATFDWKSITDEDFEELCYDIIHAHPLFDSDTIRKFGKAKSRDGGRDIEVCQAPMRFGEKPRKWIFQCKLVTDGSSLGKGKVVDVGDMLTQYGAKGFGVMTSALIDATLFDKLDAVCGARQIDQMHFSRLNIERALIAQPALRKKYFPDDA